MQPVNCFWVGLGVCSSYHSEKEKESFIVEEKKKTLRCSFEKKGKKMYKNGGTKYQRCQAGTVATERC